MLQRSQTGRCVHCLYFFSRSQLTDDHLIADAWYPDSVPQYARPVVPSCIECNQRLGKIEGALGVRLGLCIDPNDPYAGELAKKAARAVNPGVARDPKDMAHRLGLRKMIMRDWLKPDEVPNSAVVPGFERMQDCQESELQAIGLEKRALDALGEKLVRGSSYLFSRLYVEAGHEITINLMQPEDNPYEEVLAKIGRRIDIAPGISIRRAGDLPADPACGLFEFRALGSALHLRSGHPTLLALYHAGHEYPALLGNRATNNTRSEEPQVANGRRATAESSPAVEDEAALRHRARHCFLRI